MGVVKYGMTGSKTYLSWANMTQRCTNDKHPGFDNYGGRGITICARWASFENFLADMGERPEGTSIDRIDNNGNYEPGNCRWATRRQQNQNQRGNRLISHGGETLRIGQWAERLGMRETKLRERLQKGWPVELAVTLPPSKHNSVKRKQIVRSSDRSIGDDHG